MHEWMKDRRDRVKALLWGNEWYNYKGVESLRVNMIGLITLMESNR